MKAESLTLQPKSTYSRIFRHPRFNAERMLGRAYLMMIFTPMIFNYLPPIVPVLAVSSLIEAVQGRKGA